MFILKLKSGPIRDDIKTTAHVNRRVDNETILMYPRSESAIQVDPVEIAKDIEHLGLNNAPLTHIIVDFGKTKFGGVLFNRCLKQLRRIGIDGGEPVSWDRRGGLFNYTLTDIIGLDVIHICLLLAGIADRANRKVSYTHSSLTLWDIQQLSGIVHNMKEGCQMSTDAHDWFKLKLNIARIGELEILKEQRARAKEASQALQSATRRRVNVDRALEED